jgi:nicotinamidase/pyrazinamidase
MIKSHLVIIDPQNDFCDPKGSLFVPGADKDISRLSKFINRAHNKLEDIHVTLDSHRCIDVAHPTYWKDTSGKHPDPFTIITVDDVKNYRWVPTANGKTWYDRALHYVTALETGGRYPLCIWPEHCLIGSWGTQVHPELFEVLRVWEILHFASIDFVTKGSNVHTEHFSAIKAEVPDPSDPSTQINIGFIQTLEQADEIIFAGEASSHCLLNTMKDIVDNFSDVNTIKKVILLTDATSPVISPYVDFPKIAQDFINDMVSKGMRVSTTTELYK